MTPTVVVALLLLGMVPGYYLGRWRAEWGITFHEFGRVRRRRKAYRERD